MKTTLFISLFLLFVSSTFLPAQIRFTPGATVTISYQPELSKVFHNPAKLEVVFVANFWNTRRGTRLALLENVYRPDTARITRVPMRQTQGTWQADIEVPLNAGVLSYYITDGERTDDNNGRTYASYVYGPDDRPVRNAHYFMAIYLEMAGRGLDERLKEAEQEILTYPDNFRAYHDYFSLLVAWDRGSERAQNRIASRLDSLEKQYGNNPDFLNCAARTWFYILRNSEVALKYKGRIEFQEQWPEVKQIYDRDAAMEHNAERREQLNTAREGLIGAAVPPVDFIIDSVARRSMKEYKGKVVVLVFWASHSQLSRTLLGKLRDLYNTLDRSNVVFATVNIAEDRDHVRKFVKDNNYPFDNLFNNGAALQLYGVEGVPATYIIDKTGIVRQIFLGYNQGDEAEIRNAVEQWLQG